MAERKYIHYISKYQICKILTGHALWCYRCGGSGPLVCLTSCVRSQQSSVWCVHVEILEYLVKRQNDKGTTTGRLDNERQKLRIDGTETAIVSTLCEANAFVAVFLLSDTAVHMTELGTRHKHLQTAIHHDIARMSSGEGVHRPDKCIHFNMGYKGRHRLVSDYYASTIRYKALSSAAIRLSLWYLYSSTMVHFMAMVTTEH